MTFGIQFYKILNSKGKKLIVDATEPNKKTSRNSFELPEVFQFIF